MKRIENLKHHLNIIRMMCGKSKVIDLILSRLILKIPYNVYVDYCFYNKKWSFRKDYIIDDFNYFIKYNPGVTRNNHDDKRDIVKNIYHIYTVK